MRVRTLALRAGLWPALILAVPHQAAARQSWDAVRVETTHVRGDVYAILGTGANQSMVIGARGLVVVDAGYAELGPRLLAAARGLGGDDPDRRRIAYLIDTHWHFDHVGANAVYAAAEATVVAQEATAALMAEDRTMPSLDGLEVPATPPEARPTLVLSHGMTLVWGGETLEVVHLPRAHTAGDLAIYFRGADVVHLGDVFFNGMYPFIDVDHGGSLEGLVAACEEILARTGDATLFVPGHGAVATRAEFQRYARMLRTVHERVARMVDEGLTRAEVIGAKPTADLDQAWSRGGGFNDPDVWVGLVYDGYRPR